MYTIAHRLFPPEAMELRHGARRIECQGTMLLSATRP